MLGLILDLLFPQEKCCICQEPGKYNSRKPWCPECSDHMREIALKRPCCSKCGKYLDRDTGLCQECRENPPNFALARAVGPYEGPYRLSAKILKFMGCRYVAHEMGRLMAERVRQEPGFGPLDLIIPVPLSRARLSQRGFNQSGLLASAISQELRIRMDPAILLRVKDTPPQAELSREEREKNLLWAFQIKEAGKIYRKNILMVDDVYTTGSTARECSRVLLEAGAARVSLITWATGRGY